MHNNYFENGTARLGDKEIPFEKRPIQGGFTMYVPTSFFQDKNIVSNYTYLFSKDKSPLSIAIKFSAVAAGKERDKMISHYFSQSADAEVEIARIPECGILYRETVADSKFLSVYSLRFCIEVETGLLCGCFNSAAQYKDDWKLVVLQMLQNIAKD